jgi:hypothetical protein
MLTSFNQDIIMKLSIVALACLLSAPAFAVDSACLPYIEALEKMHAQPNRAQSVSSDGNTLEFIMIGNDYYAKIKQWQRMPVKFRDMEKKIALDMRSGDIKLSQCSPLKASSFEGKSYRALTLTVELAPGVKDQQTNYIGSDGLLYAMVSEGTVTRIRYTDVVAPKI